MKGAITAFVVAILLALAIFITQTLTSESVRKNALKSSVTNSCEQSLMKLKDDPDKIKSNEQLAKEFVTNLKGEISSNGDIKAEVITANYKYGMLDVKVTETYKTGQGKEKKITIRKTAVLDRAKDEVK